MTKFLGGVSTGVLHLQLPSAISTIRFYKISSLWIQHHHHHHHHHHTKLSHHHFKRPNLHCIPPVHNHIYWQCPDHLATNCRRVAVSEYGFVLLDESEQAFGEIIIALIEFIMICWLGIGLSYWQSFWIIFYILFSFYCDPPLGRINSCFLQHTSSDVAKRGGVVGTYSPYRFPYNIERKSPESQTSL